MADINSFDIENLDNLEINIRTLILFKNGKPVALVKPIFDTYNVHDSKGMRKVEYSYFNDILTGANYVRYRDYRRIIHGHPKNTVPACIRLYTLFSGYTVDSIIPFFTDDHMNELASGKLSNTSKLEIVSRILGNTNERKREFKIKQRKTKK